MPGRFSWTEAVLHGRTHSLPLETFFTRWVVRLALQDAGGHQWAGGQEAALGNPAQLSELISSAGLPSVPSFVLRGLDQEISAFLGGFEGISKKQQEKVGKRWQLEMRVAGCLPGTKKSCHPLVSGGIHVLLKSVWEMPTWVILNIWNYLLMNKRYLQVSILKL